MIFIKGSNPVCGHPLLPLQEALYTLLGTGWSQEKIRKWLHSFHQKRIKSSNVTTTELRRTTPAVRSIRRRQRVPSSPARVPTPTWRISTELFRRLSTESSAIRRVRSAARGVRPAARGVWPAARRISIRLWTNSRCNATSNRTAAAKPGQRPLYRMLLARSAGLALLQPQNYGEPPPTYAPYGGGSAYPSPQQGYPHPHGGYPQTYSGGYPQYPQPPGGYGQQPGGYPYGYGQTVVVTQPQTVQQPQSRDKDRTAECCLLGLLVLVCCCCLMD